MTETSISTRVDSRLAEGIAQYMECEHLEKSSAIRKLLHKSIGEWRVEHALKKLEDGEFSLTRAAKFADMDVFTFMNRVKKSGIRWVDQQGVLEDLDHL